MIEIMETLGLTTVQDLGRSGKRRYGVGTSGAMDRLAVAVGNLLLGNEPDMAALEITMPPFKARFHRNVSIALCGADFDATLDGRPISAWWGFPVRAGQVLALQRPKLGARAYLCVSGGLTVPTVLGSRSTHLRAQFGGFHGRILQKGDELPIGNTGSQLAAPAGIHPPGSWFKGPTQKGLTLLRVIPASEYDLFTDESIQRFWDQEWKITPQSNRAGYRLSGDVALETTVPIEMRSHGILPGVIQVPPSGQPIIQLADANASGGYPKMGAVISADLWRIGQASLGTQIKFVKVTHDEAVAALNEQHQMLREYQNAFRWVKRVRASTGPQTVSEN